jgi:hypothetical protein
MSLETTRQAEMSMFFNFIDMTKVTWSPGQHVPTIVSPERPFQNTKRPSSGPQTGSGCGWPGEAASEGRR